MDEQDLSGQRRGKGIPGRGQRKERLRGGREVAYSGNFSWVGMAGMEKMAGD